MRFNSAFKVLKYEPDIVCSEWGIFSGLSSVPPGSYFDRGTAASLRLCTIRDSPIIFLSVLYALILNRSKDRAQNIIALLSNSLLFFCFGILIDGAQFSVGGVNIR